MTMFWWSHEDVTYDQYRQSRRICDTHCRADI